MNHAATMMLWAIRTIKDGRTIASVDEANQKWRELQMPMLEKYRPSTE